MSKVQTWAGIIYFFASSAVLFTVAALVCLCTFWFDRNRRILHYFASWWGHHYMMVNPSWKVRYEGLDYIDPAKTYVIVAKE